MLIAWNVILAALCAGLALAIGLLALQNRSQYPTAAALLRAIALPLVLGGISLLAIPPSAATTELAAPEPDDLRAALDKPADFPVNPTLAPTLRPADATHTAALSAPRTGALVEPLGTPQPQPARLRIARLNVDAPIVTIPIVNGQWDLTTLGADVGWLTTTGAFPGDKLAMALVGHITTERLTRGAFADLERIKPGDEIVYILGEVEYVYEVRRRSRIAPENVKALYMPDGQTLLLLTCTDWDAEGKRYANRLLVEAELRAQRAAKVND